MKGNYTLMEYHRVCILVKAHSRHRSRNLPAVAMVSVTLAALFFLGGCQYPPSSLTSLPKETGFDGVALEGTYTAEWGDEKFVLQIGEFDEEFRSIAKVESKNTGLICHYLVAVHRGPQDDEILIGLKEVPPNVDEDDPNTSLMHLLRIDGKWYYFPAWLEHEAGGKVIVGTDYPDADALAKTRIRVHKPQSKNDNSDFYSPLLLGSDEEIFSTLLRALTWRQDKDTVVLTRVGADASTYPEFSLGVEIYHNDGSVMIRRVLEGSSAEAAGLKSGDVITGLNEHRNFTSTYRFEKLLDESAAKNNGFVAIRVHRDGSSVDLPIQLGKLQLKPFAEPQYILERFSILEQYTYGSGAIVHTFEKSSDPSNLPSNLRQSDRIVYMASQVRRFAAMLRKVDSSQLPNQLEASHRELVNVLFDYSTRFQVLAHQPKLAESLLDDFRKDYARALGRWGAELTSAIEDEDRTGAQESP